MSSNGGWKPGRILSDGAWGHNGHSGDDFSYIFYCCRVLMVLRKKERGIRSEMQGKYQLTRQLTPIEKANMRRRLMSQREASSASGEPVMKPGATMVGPWRSWMLSHRDLGYVTRPMTHPLFLPLAIRAHSQSGILLMEVLVSLQVFHGRRS